jgi:hypothetical protein
MIGIGTHTNIFSPHLLMEYDVHSLPKSVPILANADDTFAITCLSPCSIKGMNILVTRAGPATLARNVDNRSFILSVVVLSSCRAY